MFSVNARSYYLTIKIFPVIKHGPKSMKWVDITILKSGFSARHLLPPRKEEFSHGNKSVRDW